MYNCMKTMIWSMRMVLVSLTSAKWTTCKWPSLGENCRVCPFLMVRTQNYSLYNSQSYPDNYDLGVFLSNLVNISLTHKVIQFSKHFLFMDWLLCNNELKLIQLCQLHLFFVLPPAASSAWISIFSCWKNISEIVQSTVSFSMKKKL